MEMQELEEVLREITTVVKERKKDLAAKQDEVEEVRNSLKELDVIRTRTKDVLTNLEEEVQTVQKQEFDKADKLKRAECQLKKVMKRLSRTDMSKYNRDFEIRQMRDANKNVQQRLIEMAMEYQEMAPLIFRYAIEHNVQLPEKKFTPSISSSSLSSLSSCSSKNKVTNTARTDVSDGPSINKIDLSLQF